MDKKFIKVLIEEGTPIANLPEADAMKKLNGEITTVYVMNGLHRGMPPQDFAQEVRTCTVAMFRELTADPVYKTIRDKEVPYIFSNGMKGRLGTDKDYVLTYKSLIRWVEGYVRHAERREALAEFYEENRPKPKELPAHEPTEADYKKLVESAWEDFKEYKRTRRSLADKPSSGPKGIGEIIGRMPLTCLDYGGRRIDYLRKVGMAAESESLIDYFERRYSKEV